MQRYFLDSPFGIDGTAKIQGGDGKHIVKVMRMDVGNRIIAVTNGEAFVSEIIDLLSDGVVISRKEGPLTSNEMPVEVTIACGLPKGDKLDLIVQKGTELGMRAIIPFEAERSIVKWDSKKGDKKVERLSKIAKEAAEQCHRTFIPEVQAPLSFKQLLLESKNYDIRLFADEEDAKSVEPNRIADRLKNVYHKQTVLVVFGPEGGLSRKEADALVTAKFLSVSLGPRILRTETAPLYLLSAMSYEFE
ncbi:16S rRNA (uracil(1498)-N(3))-methyltransferase [Sporosarcina highlanderae]|uniref:Ribosomal RNA small subunit methyltransferase E n=1 Tax=Sporosarcina highlanderae TaxID=3035916 RepID=A0ABT8JQL0_9BACL|nr:16S rRNA (uracil(1498)-N(3))-methyltransferase [Sporosarcina highlanderae]MDN4607063.1 16S rRNA (uracil(1498)-N(3))-methyltransferase [Sporosarcina highlanderae]